MRSRILLIFLSCCSVAFAEGKTIKAVKTNQAPFIDGRLDEDCWQNTDLRGKDFYALQKKELATEQTIFYVRHDEEKIYLGVHCLSKNTDMLRKRGRENPRYFKYEEGENVEIFLDPGSSRKEYLQLIINTNGTSVMRMVTQDRMQNGNPWEYAVYIDQDGYSMEIALPLAYLHLSGRTGTSWGLNVARTHSVDKHMETHHKFSSWNPVPSGGFGQPEQFGVLELNMDFSRFALSVAVNDGNNADLIVRDESGQSRELLLKAEYAANNRTSTSDSMIATSPESATGVHLKAKPGSLTSIKIIDPENEQILYWGIPEHFVDLTPDFPGGAASADLLQDDLLIETGNLDNLESWKYASYFYPPSANSPLPVPVYKDSSRVKYSANPRYFQEGSRAMQIDFPEKEFNIRRKLVYFYMEKSFIPSNMERNDCFIMDLYNAYGLGNLKVFLVDTASGQHFLKHVYIDKGGMERIVIRKEDVLQKNPSLHWNRLNMLRLIFFGDFTFYLSGIRMTNFGKLAPLQQSLPIDYVAPVKIDITPLYK